MLFTYGNYCGPWWSAGKDKGSVDSSNVKPIDEFDQKCKHHDRAYARHYDAYTELAKADIDFANSTIGKGVDQSIASIIIGTQGLLKQYVSEISMGLLIFLLLIVILFIVFVIRFVKKKYKK